MLLVDDRNQYCIGGQNSKTVNPGKANTYICSVDAASPYTLFRARGGINCDTSVLHSSTGNSLVGGCRNDAGQLALVFNGTANGQRDTIRFTLKVIDSAVTNTCVMCLDGNGVLGEVLITGQLLAFILYMPTNFLHITASMCACS